MRWEVITGDYTLVIFNFKNAVVKWRCETRSWHDRRVLICVCMTKLRMLRMLFLSCYPFLSFERLLVCLLILECNWYVDVSARDRSSKICQYKYGAKSIEKFCWTWGEAVKQVRKVQQVMYMPAWSEWSIFVYMTMVSSTKYLRWLCCTQSHSEKCPWMICFHLIRSDSSRSQIIAQEFVIGPRKGKGRYNFRQYF